jgi:hypothetical protein
MAAQDKLALIRDRATRWHGTQKTKEHELDLYIVTKALPAEDTTRRQPLTLELKKVVPRPRIISSTLTMVGQSEGRGSELAAVGYYKVEDVSRRNYSEDALKKVLYYVVCDSSVVPNPLDVQAGKHLRYKIAGDVTMNEQHWSFKLEEMK